MVPAVAVPALSSAFDESPLGKVVHYSGEGSNWEVASGWWEAPAGAFGTPGYVESTTV